MSIILYQNGEMAADSGFCYRPSSRVKIFNQNRTLQKITLSTNGHTAFCIVGDVPIVSPIRVLADIFESRIIEYGSIDCGDIVLSTKVREYCRLNKITFDGFIMSSIIPTAYNVRYESNEADESARLLITVLSNDNDVYAAGTGELFGTMAVISGKSVIDAVKFAIERDNSCKGPIISISVNDLMKYSGPIGDGK